MRLSLHHSSPITSNTFSTCCRMFTRPPPLPAAVAAPLDLAADDRMEAWYEDEDEEEEEERVLLSPLWDSRSLAW